MREKGRGVWELRVRAGRDPLTGKYRQVSRTFRGGKRQAEAALAVFATEVAGGEHAGAEADLALLLDKWVEQLEVVGRSPKTIEGYRSLSRARLKPALGHIRLTKLAPADLERFYRALLADGLSPTSVRHCHAALSTALRQAVKWGWIDRSPADRASPPSVPHHDVKPPTAAEVAQLFEELERTNHDLASMIFVAATTGCRRGELCGLRWPDIDLEAGTLVVRRSIMDTKGGVAEKDPKTHRARRIALDATTVQVLAGQRSRMMGRAAAFGATMAANPYVWSQHYGGAEPYRPGRVTDTFRTVRNRLGLQHLDFHHLRHFAATTLAGAGVDIRTIAGRLATPTLPSR